MLRAYTPEQPRTIFDNYMHSIVRAAPRLEELGFHGADTSLRDFVRVPMAPYSDSSHISLMHTSKITVADDLNGFCHLRRLYYIDRALSPNREFCQHAGELAALVPRLESITNVGASDLPYRATKIRRDVVNESLTVVLCEGYGMQTGHDDDAFPWAPQSAVNVVVVPRSRRDTP